MTDASPAERPPLVPFCLSVGITGHRAAVLAQFDTELLRERLHAVFAGLRDAALRLHAAEPTAFAAQPLPPRLICPLAEGADQMAAEVSLDLGFELHATLPFQRAHYAVDFESAAALARFEALLARAARVLELPCQRAEERSAYALAGRATIAHCDVLVAVWDGLPARGKGGTAEVVELAVRRGVPVIHLPLDPALPPQIIWSAHDPHLAHSRFEDFVARGIDADGLDRLLRERLGPPDDSLAREHLANFYAEHQRRFRPRLEYTLLQAATGARPLRGFAPWVAPYLADTRAEWAPFRSQATRLVGDLPLDRVEQAYAWSDRLAAHYAQTYRSGHVFNFVLGAVAVLLGLSGLLTPGIKLWLAFAELAAIGGFVVNTRVGIARNWHRRWLDYRQLAERLRPMRGLTLIGLAQPDLGAASRGTRSWVDWYAAGIWRSVGIPSGRLDTDVTGLTAFVVAEDIQPQIAYHRASAAAISHLDHRLHSWGTILFALSCLSCAAFIVAYLVSHDWTARHAAAFVALSAGLPAIGTAFFGIRVQGDFAGTAARSLVTADHLAAIVAALEVPGIGLSRAADGTEAAARAMLADLGEWRLSHQQRQLELG